MKTRLITGAAALAALYILPAAAGTTPFVIGANDAKRCELAARAENPFRAKEAIADCDRALNVTPLSAYDKAATVVNRGILKNMMKDTAGAVADFNVAIGMRENLAEAYANRGVSMKMEGKYDAAIADFSKAIELGTSNLHGSFFNRGAANEAKGQFTAAYRDFARAAEINPAYQPAQERIAVYTPFLKK